MQRMKYIYNKYHCNLFQFASLSVYNTTTTKTTKEASSSNDEYPENHVKASTTTNNEPLQIQNDTNNTAIYNERF